ncbi:Crp/Fnr family transcriptional regulator [Paludibacter jiangxiensis]|uniref:cAMP-binding domain of CRP n=1 Tax=Paludibacter jiangxiensis TaxID=681398 RepID=A0A170YWV8_9BACT|nr:Crp/Fnr family transcriptional regulator [Paludibacter jiangxiensis]GAT62141.1 cAMP-binding domain of CRP [Paludibacter jiangxiensis]
MAPKQTTDLSILSLPGIWDVLTGEQLDYLRSNSKMQQFKRNEMIYCEGETPTHLLCLIKGKVKIYKDGVGGRSQIVRMIKPIDYFGYRAFFAEEPYLTAACAVETAMIFMIPSEVIGKLLKENNELALFFIKAMAIDLGIADTRIVNLTQKHIRGRLAESILFLVDSYGLEEDGATLNIYLSRDDLASLSNMTTSNAIRTLSNFATEKIIAVDGRKIKVIDEERLRKISRIG